MTERKSPAQGEALIIPGKVDRRSLTKITRVGLHSAAAPVARVPEGAVRMLKPYVLVQRTLDHPDCAQTKLLTFFDTEEDATMWARSEAAGRGVEMVRAVGFVAGGRS